MSRGPSTRAHTSENKGFTTADLLGLSARGRDLGGRLYQRYINGRSRFPYETVLPKAHRVARKTQSTPFWRERPNGDSGKLVVQSLVPGSAAETAGLEPAT